MTNVRGWFQSRADMPDLLADCRTFSYVVGWSAVMANSASDQTARISNQILAARYVLGTLSQPVMREAERKVKTDEKFAACVKRWRKAAAELGIFSDLVSPVPSPPRKTFGSLVRAKILRSWKRMSWGLKELWRSANIWRATTICLLIYIGINA